ncbi:thioredoxin family protein [Flavobacterium sp.]|uniref:thioredoxin family protein n=1 Tax=Flavobacterium sp. TaxID=239 RepID=UPI0037518ED0
MKKITFIIALLITTLGFSQEWKSDIEEAKAQAAKEGKNILLVFSGSDWCGPCMKLDKIVWKSEIFKTESEKKWVLVKADFPKKKGNVLSPELTASNNRLAEKYNKSGNFPLVVLLDNTGRVIGMTGFKNVSAEEYVKIINALLK